MTPHELKELLLQYAITPVRSRGQHFLLDESVVQAMVAAAGVEKGTNVVEIGPGPGILTAELLRHGANIVAVELDMRLARLLRERFKDTTFRLIEGDATRFSNAKLAAEFENAPYHLVANLPYGITSETLIKFLSQEPLPLSITVMLQREVADRILAEPGDMSSLAVMVQTLGETRRVVNVAATKFFPPPKVSSSVVHIRVKTAGERAIFFGGVRQETFFSIVRTGFSGKRKKLKNSLSSLISTSKMAPDLLFQTAGVRGDARPEELSVDDWRRLAQCLHA